MIAPFMILFYVITFFIFLAGVSLGQVDDFEDGDDVGWTHLDPLGGLGAGEIASYAFEGGFYRISAAESPAPAAAGPSRAASLQQDVIYQDRVFMSVDFMLPDPGLKQAVGFVVFVQPDPSLGTTSGYSLNYQPVDNDLILNRLTNEAPTRLSLASLTGVAGASLRLVLMCEDGCFIGKLFNAENLWSPIATVTAKDSTYNSGTAGLFVFADRDDGTGTTDVVFDHYRANALITPPLELVSRGTDYELRWPEWAVHFSPEETLDLGGDSWSPVVATPILSEGAFVLRQNFSTARRSFFRLAGVSESNFIATGPPQ